MNEYPQAESPVRLGPISGYAWETDPRHLVFTLSRYKFVAKMLRGMDAIAEIGCGDGFASKIVLQASGGPVALYDREARGIHGVVEHDIIAGPLPSLYDGIYALDVLEHIHPKDEMTFFANCSASLKPHGVMVIGSPSLESQPYAAPHNRRGHINCKTGSALRQLSKRFFHAVFLFSMNDEVVSTGFSAMSHYNIVLCADARQP